jgi:hypothetical protein
VELSGRPLFDNPRDAALFVPRNEAGQLEANCRDGINSLVLGDRGSGKTSLLRYVYFRLRESEFPAVAVDAGPAESPLELLRLISGSRGGFRRNGPQVNAVTLAGLGDTGAILEELRALRSGRVLEGPRTAILIDLPPGSKMHGLFGRFRDELWQLPYTWIVFAQRSARLELLTPPANAFFEDVVELQPLTPEQQDELVKRRLAADEPTPWELPSGGEGNPRRLLAAVRESVRSGEPPNRRIEAQAERDLQVADLGSAAASLYAELENYGPASASDSDLLARLGWSRQRAAQVLSALEGAGFVRGERLHGSSGRPRKVFTIIPPGKS